MKRILLIAGLVIAIIVGALALIPVFFGDEIREAILKEVNKDLDGELSIGDVDLSLFKSFPDLRVDIAEVKLISNIDTSQELLNCRGVYLDLDLMSVLKKTETVKINGIHLVEPDVYISFDTAGRGNFDLLPSDESKADSSSGSYAVDIRDYSIKDGRFTYSDPKAGTSILLNDLNHQGSGHLNGNNLDWITTTDVDGLTVIAGGTGLLKDVKVKSNLNLTYDMARQSLTLKENSIGINALAMEVLGDMAFVEKGIEMNLIATSPGNQLADLWSVLPSQTKVAVGDVSAKGSFGITGKAKGLFDAESGALPDLDLDLVVENGFVSYSQLPQSLKEIEVVANYLSKSNGKNVIVDIDQLSFKAGQSWVDAVLHIEPESNDVRVDGSGKVDLDLADLPLGKGYSGNIDMDLAFNGRKSDIVAQRYGKINMRGTGNIKDLKISVESLPEIKLNSSSITFSPSAITTEDVTARIEDSDFEGKVKVENPLGFLVAGVSPKVVIQSQSERVDVNKIMSSMSTTDEGQATAPIGGPILPFGMQVDWTGRVNTLLYDSYEISAIKGGLVVDGQSMDIRPSELTYMSSPIQIKGQLNSLDVFMADAGPLTGHLDIEGQALDLNSFMSSTSTDDGSPTEAEPIALPANMDLLINSNLGSVKYEDITLDNVRGAVSLHDQMIDLRDVTAGYLGGKMKLEGQFMSDGTQEPAFNFKYDVVKLPFEGVIEQVKWIDQIMPLSHYIKGVFNSTFLFEGTLGKDMMPKLGDLTVSGYIETLEAALGALPFMEKLSKKVSVKELQGVALENTKNWFEIKDGKFFIQPFETSYKGIQLEIGGYTGLDKTMDFDISADIPRELFDQLPGGNELNNGVQWLTDEVNKRGISFGEIKSYKLGIDLSGDVKDPAVKVKLLNLTKGTMKETVDVKKEEIKQKLKDTLETKKEEVIKEVEEKVEKKKEELRDTVNQRLQEEKQKLLDKAKEEAEKKVDSTLLKEAEKVIGKEKIDELKDKLNKFDPFKRKK